MSLINEALKKAQNLHAREAAAPASATSGSKLRLVTPEPAPDQPEPSKPLTATPATTVAHSARPSRKPGLVLAGAGVLCAVAVVALAAAVYLHLQKPDTSTVAQAVPAAPIVADASSSAPSADLTPPAGPVTSPAPEPPKARVVVPSTAPAEAATSAATSGEPALASLPTDRAPIAAASATTTDPAAVGASISDPDPATAPRPVAEPAEVVAPKRSDAPAAPAPAPAPVRINQPDPALQAFVAAIQITGIRTGSSPKVLMNDRVYSIGEWVNPEQSLKLTKIASDGLQFEDLEGNTYEARF